jgi:phage baseplate assembly protein gpV/phage protein D
MHVLALPQVTIETTGVPLPESDRRALAEVRVQQRLGLPALCELTFSDPPGPLDGIPARLMPGIALRVLVGEQREPLFTGEVTAVEHVYGPARGREVRVRGYDLLHRLRKRQSVRAHVQVTPAGLARELTADLGLTVQAPEDGPMWKHVIQGRQSDFDLLAEMAEACGLFLAVREDTLHLMTLAGTGEPEALSLGETLLEARCEVNGDPACRTVKTSGWNPLRVEPHEGTAGSARSGREVAAEVLPADVGGSGERDLVNATAADERHAEAQAQAELDLRLAREVTFWGVAAGHPRLQPGTPVDVSGVAAAVAGRYVLTAVTHTIDARTGFLSEVATAPPEPRTRAAGTAAVLGVVTRVDDPDGLGRICVKLPAYSGVETDWMNVVIPAAGKDKGFMALPDVGDRVLVLCAHEDPGQGVVIGGLYGVDGWPDTGVDGAAVKRFTWLTPGGQRIRLDDARQAVRVENQGGSFVELSPEKVKVHAAVDLEIEAPGHSVVIRGRKIDFQRQ